MDRPFRFRRDVTENWQSKNPVLGLGELAVDTKKAELKVGDGITPWVNLPKIKSNAAKQNIKVSTSDKVLYSHIFNPSVDGYSGSIAHNRKNRANASVLFRQEVLVDENNNVLPMPVSPFGFNLISATYTEFNGVTNYNVTAGFSYFGAGKRLLLLGWGYDD